MNNINDTPLSNRLSFLYAEYIPSGILTKYAMKIEIIESITCIIFYSYDDLSGIRSRV